MVYRLVLGIFAGLLVSTLAGLLFLVSLSGNDENAIVRLGAFVFLLGWMFSVLLCLTADNLLSASGRLLFCASVLIYALPMATFVFTGQQVGNIGSEGGVLAGGFAALSALAGGLISAISGILGFVTGTLMLVSSLLFLRAGRALKEFRSEQDGPDQNLHL